MSDPNERLAWARETAGYETAADAARAMDIPPPTYQAHENGSRGFRLSAQRYAQKFRVSFEWLVTGKGVPRAGTSLPIPVVGYVGAGAEVYSIDDHAKGAGLEEIEAPFPVPSSTVCVVVRGDSMLPVFEDGDLIGYSKEPGSPDEAIGHRCLVKLRDGRMFIKVLKRGSTPGLFTLVSFNAADIEDVEVEWAAEYDFALPRGRWHYRGR